MNHTEHTAKTPSPRTGISATLRALLGAKGGGAPSRRHRASILLFLSVALLSLLALPGLASAAGGKHPFSGIFGSASQPTFTTPQSLAVDGETGDLLVLDAGANEEQELTIEAASGLGGTYKLSFEGQTTGAAFTGQLTSASKVVKSVVVTEGAISKGEQITCSGTGCPTGTVTVSNPTKGTGEIELSAAATATGSATFTANLPFSATNTVMKEALEKLSTVGAGNVTATGTGSTSPVKRTIVFQSRLAGKNLPTITCDGSGLTGTSPTCGITKEVNGAPNGIKRYTASGEAAPFTALGTNVIDGKRGSGGKPCNEESASCDEVPQEFLTIGKFNESQIAVDNSGVGSATHGDIYVTQDSTHVAVFAPTGQYLAQLTEYFSDEAQKLTLAGGFEFLGHQQIVIGNLPALCSSSTTGPINYVATAEFGTNILTALVEKCGPNFTASGSAGATVGFINALSAKANSLLTCQVLSGPGTCTFSVSTPGHEPKKKIGEGAGGRACGVAVGGNGVVYVGDSTPSSGKVHRYVPSTNPVSNADNQANFSSTAVPCNLAVGTGSTAGYLFPVGNQKVEKVNALTGEPLYVVATASEAIDTVNPTSGQVLVASGSVVTEYEAESSLGPVSNSTLTAPGTVRGVAVDAAGHVYIARAGESHIEVYGPPQYPPIANVFAPAGVTATEATLRGSVNPQGTPLKFCRFEYISEADYQANGGSFTGGKAPTTVSCAQTVSGNTAQPVSAQVIGLSAETTYHIRLSAENEAGPITSTARTFTTLPVAVTNPATEVSANSATLNGEINPVGVAFSTCKFEYITQEKFLANGSSYSGANTSETKACTPAAGSIEADYAAHAVSAAVGGPVGGLASDTTYHFRVVATKGASVYTGADLTFTTVGPPLISEVISYDATQDSAVLQAKINPQGSPTTYHFEYDTTPYGAGEAAHGTRIPAGIEGSAGEGKTPTIVKAELSGLQEGTQYYFRLVATSSRGTTTSPGQQVQTPNACGMTDDRCAELVSPADKKPAGAVRPFAPTQVLFQAAEDGEHAAYPILNGTDESTAGGELIFTSDRSAEAWRSAQLSPPSLIPPLSQEAAAAGKVRYIDRKDFKCAVIESFNPLTSDTPQIDVEDGVVNLYLWSASTDSYTLITNRVPLNPRVERIGNSFEVAGASSDCSKIFFRAPSSVSVGGPANYEYLPNATGLYEWDEGVLSDAGLRPDGTAPPAGSAGNQVALNEWSVSPEGRLFFTATSDAGNDSGKAAVFVRKSPTEVVDASLSKTGTATTGARYETATPDGSHVFFQANYGLTSVSSHGGSPVACNAEITSKVSTQACDLYDYDVETGELTDISADSNSADVNGAVTQGIMDISKDGSTVYFSALGQLIPGKGPTYNQNLQGNGTASLYRWHEGHIVYVGELSVEDLDQNSSGNNQGALIRSARVWVGQTDDDGQYLLFVSRANMLGNNPRELAEAYFYSASEETLNCISCAPDGQAPKTYPGEPLRELITTQATQGEGFDNYHPSSLSDDGRAFFNSFEALAPGAVAGQANVYEWYRGQVSLLTTSKALKYGNILLSKFVGLGGPNGRDAFVVSLERLVGQDTDLATDLYDLRSGGGFPAPEVPPPPCEPALDQCQSGGSGAPSATEPNTAGFHGSGNPAPQVPKKPKPKHHKKHQKHHKKTKHNKGGKAGRAASVDHGGVK